MQLIGSVSLADVGKVGNLWPIGNRPNAGTKRVTVAIGILVSVVCSWSARASTPMSCLATSTAPRLRAEAMTELVTDIVLTCTGGQMLKVGSEIPTADFTLSLSTNVTSRIIDKATGLSEAMLLIDEPGSGLPASVPGYGPGAPQKACLSPQGAGPGGCVEYVQALNGVPVPSSSPTSLTGPPPNIFFGSAKANQITFHGIPMLPPSPGSPRTFRVTNVRISVASLGGGAFFSTGILAAVFIGDSTPVQNATVIAGFFQSGLNTTVRNITDTESPGSTAFSQCGSSVIPVPVAMLRFGENFPNAFRPRVAPPTLSANGQSGTAQNIPGAIYNSESGFIFPAFSGSGHVAGLADYGTRLKAVFHHIPTGVRIFVSTTSLTNTSAPTPAPPAPTSTASYATLVPDEAFVGNVSPVPVSSTTTNGNSTGLAELSVIDGTAQAAWEVISTNPDANEAFSFGIWLQISPHLGANPPAGTVTVNMSYAPTAPGAFSNIDDATASSSMPIARFADNSLTRNLFSITPCGKHPVWVR